MSTPDVDIIVCDDDGNEIETLYVLSSVFISRLFDSEYIETLWGRTLLDGKTIVEIFNKVNSSWKHNSDKYYAMSALSIGLLHALSAVAENKKVMLEGY